MDHPPLHSRQLTMIHCGNLRHKGMYVSSDSTVENDYDNQLGASSYWCVCTQKAFGPDGRAVNAGDCIDGRECCEH